MPERDNTSVLRGFWLNLDAGHDRRRFMNSQLESLGMSGLYERIPGVLADPSQAQDYGLKPGELGAWLGWMKLLESAAESSSPMVHLLEDDTEITDRFKNLLRWQPLRSALTDRQFVCTDAYIDPVQAMQIVDHALVTEDSSDWLVMNSGPRIPCLNSILLSPACACRVLEQLKRMMRQGEQLPPVDVALASLSVEWITIVPFATGPILDLSMDSATRLDSEVDLDLSRFTLTLLRRSLMANQELADLRRGMLTLMLKMIRQGVLRPF